MVGTALDGAWVLPSPCHGTSAATSDTTAEPLTAEQVAAWRTRGWVLVDGLWPASLCERVVEEIAQHEQQEQECTTSGPVSPFSFDGNPGRASIGDPLEFPSVCPAINAITLHPRITAACRQLLGQARTNVSSLRLVQSQLLTRTGPPAGEQSTAEDLFTNAHGQRIHTDFPNNTLLAPPAFGTPAEAVQCLLYLSDVKEVGGTTAIVGCNGPDDEAYYGNPPLTGHLGIPPHIWTNDRQQTEALCQKTDPELAAFRERLYAREQLVKYTCGTALLYRMDTWHRGTQCWPGVTRRTMQLAVRDAEAEWCTSWHRGWSRHMYDPDWTFERLLAKASVEQRCLLGWPAPGHRYWTVANLAAVAKRYSPLGFDPEPYADAAQTMGVGGGVQLAHAGAAKL